MTRQPPGKLFADCLVVLRGGGDLATGVAFRLWRAGFPLVMIDLAQPLAIRRRVAFAGAIYAGETTVEGITARHVRGREAVLEAWAQGVLPVAVAGNDSLAAWLKYALTPST